MVVGLSGKPKPVSQALELRAGGYGYTLDERR